MTTPDLREAVAMAIRHSLRLTGSCVREDICSDASCACCLEAGDAALSVIRAHCLERVREIHSRVHMTDSDAFAEQVRQRALVAWQLAEDCNTRAAGAVGGE